MGAGASWAAAASSQRQWFTHDDRRRREQMGLSKNVSLSLNIFHSSTCRSSGASWSVMQVVCV